MKVICVLIGIILAFMLTSFIVHIFSSNFKSPILYEDQHVPSVIKTEETTILNALPSNDSNAILYEHQISWELEGLRKKKAHFRYKVEVRDCRLYIDKFKIQFLLPHLINNVDDVKYNFIFKSAKFQVAASKKEIQIGFVFLNLARDDKTLEDSSRKYIDSTFISILNLLYLSIYSENINNLDEISSNAPNNFYPSIKLKNYNNLQTLDEKEKYITEITSAGIANSLLKQCFIRQKKKQKSHL
ncbi:hypothetical protein EDEG_00465 [Edhazardia aedis USNM 41457]|uniref:Uncharacterized protein n=1 Tax=Edhazardia aedis (strain USNM 41457) TaxID=1003232 RepID=J9DFI2_EDHAE|nr:hypothetical protein EDEG_00465 [Edhazardia aedis USNM 41457]|eukprot:EJW01360.1 hypothetical protein EDEG_00465 [Edhazardia aedis USNM 41457]